ncbi:MAG: DUF881 domain-containing protein [Dermatophilaceae bacterium]
MDRTDAGRADQPLPWPWLVPVATLVAGALFASSVRASDGSASLRSDSARLPDLIREQTRSNEQRSEQVGDLQSQVDDATSRLAPGDEETLQLQRAAADLTAAAGRTTVVGPALSVSLDDATLVNGEVPPGADPDDYVIHQQDVQAVVNALWAGGAEAMMLQDQRVVSTSAVRCVGNTLILQGRVYSPPYVVTAIGDIDRMRRSLDRDSAIDVVRQWSVAVGLTYTVDQLGTRTFPAYSGSITAERARVPRS